jgi:hypothetical protein
MVKVEIIDGSLNINIEKGFIDNIKHDNIVSGNVINNELTLAEVRDLLTSESYIAQMIDDLIYETK